VIVYAKVRSAEQQAIARLVMSAIHVCVIAADSSVNFCGAAATHVNSVDTVPAPTQSYPADHALAAIPALLVQQSALISVHLT
jgi:hypothetical protein